jgi:hypothetical protein
MKLRRRTADPAAMTDPADGPSSGTFSALVIDAAPPPQNLTAVHYGDWVYVVADLPDGPTLLRSVVKLDADRWLVPGTRVQIAFDRSEADAVHAFEVDWASVAPIRDRLAASDPVLTDPRTARGAALDARRAARVGFGDRPGGVLSRVDQPLMGAPMTGTLSPHPHLDTADWSAAYDRALQEAASSTSNDRRGVAVLVAMRIVLRSIGHHLDGTPAASQVGDAGAGPERSMRGNEAVFAVTVPGQPTRALFVDHFQSPRDKRVTTQPQLYPWLPVVVADDWSGFDVLWDEVGDTMDQVAGIAETHAAANQATVQSVVDAYQGAGGSADPEAGAWAMQAKMQELYGDNPQFQQAQAEAARRRAAASEAPVTDPSATAPASSPAAGSDDAADAAVRQGAAALAAQLDKIPASMRQMVLDQTRQSFDALPPDLRDRYLEVYRSMGVPL